MTDPKPASIHFNGADYVRRDLYDAEKARADLAERTSQGVMCENDDLRKRIAELEEQLSGKTFFCAECEQRQRRIAELEAALDPDDDGTAPRISMDRRELAKERDAAEKRIAELEAALADLWNGGRSGSVVARVRRLVGDRIR